MAQIVPPEGITAENYTATYDQSPTTVGLHTVTLTGTGAYTGTIQLTYEVYLKKGHTYTAKGYCYRLTKRNTVTVTGAFNQKKKKVVIANTINLGGRTCKVTAVGKKAFSGWKRLQRVTIGKNVTKIGAKAFAGDRKLKKISFRGNKIPKIGRQAFVKINKNAKFS